MGTFGPGEILFLFRLGDGFEADGTDRFNVSVGVQTANEGPLPQWRGNHGNLLSDKLGCRKSHGARPDAFFLQVDNIEFERFGNRQFRSVLTMKFSDGTEMYLAETDSGPWRIS